MFLCTVLLLGLSFPLFSLEGCLLVRGVVGDLCSSAHAQGTVFGSVSEGGCLDPTATVQGGRSQPHLLVEPYLKQMLLLLCAWCHSLLAGPELLLPIGPSLLEILSPRLLWLLNPLPFPWQLCVFGSGTKLLEDFESLTGAAVPHYWLWTSGPRCCPHPALGCTLLAKTLLFYRGKAASTMETVTGSKEITTVCIIINNSRSLYWRLLLIFSFDRSLLKDQTCFRKGECKHYFISLL